MQKLRRIEIVAFRRRAIVVGEVPAALTASRDESARPADILAGCDEHIRFAMCEVSVVDDAAENTVAAARVLNEIPANKLRSGIMRRTFGRLRIGLNNLRNSRSNNYGGKDEHS